MCMMCGVPYCSLLCIRDCLTSSMRAFEGVLALMIELLCTLHSAPSDWMEQDVLMRIQLLSYICSLCALNRNNCKYV